MSAANNNNANANASANASAGGETIVIAKNFDITRLTFGQPKQQANGGRTIFIAYAGKQLYMQTPDMKAPFGVSVWPSDNGGPDKHSIDLSFEGRETSEPISQFFDALQQIDSRVVRDGNENSQLWLKKKFPSEDVVRALYTPTIKHSKNRETGEEDNRYAPTFKMTLPFKDGQFQCPCYRSRREEVDLHEVIQSGRSKGARVQAIVQLSAIWVVGQKFGLMWKVRQLKISEPVRLSGYAFVPTDDDAPEDDEEEAPAPTVRRIAAPPSAAAAAAGSSKGGAASSKGKQQVMAESDDDEKDAAHEQEAVKQEDEDDFEP